PFITQSAVRELFFIFRKSQIKIGLVFDRFDLFYETASSKITNSLRALRDSFKETIFYLICMRHEFTYLSRSKHLGELHELIDERICWVSSMTNLDARELINQELHRSQNHLTEEEISIILELSGNFPALLKAICNWWLIENNKKPIKQWAEQLSQYPPIQFRLEELLSGLSQEELSLLIQLHMSSLKTNNAFFTDSPPKVQEQRLKILSKLILKGVCKENGNHYSIQVGVLRNYLNIKENLFFGRIWVDEKSGDIFQGEKLIENLAPLEHSLLKFLLSNPRERHTKTDIIINAWPDELRKKGVTDDSLYQVIIGIRKKIEPLPTKPCYLVNWRGKPEGGYQLYPEGRPSYLSN
ncbi:MAG: winged helix-turn-helix domain-containing protein, partial [Chloroflexota bacterium]